MHKMPSNLFLKLVYFILTAFTIVVPHLLFAHPIEFPRQKYPFSQTVKWQNKSKPQLLLMAIISPLSYLRYKASRMVRHGESIIRIPLIFSFG